MTKVPSTSEMKATDAVPPSVSTEAVGIEPIGTDLMSYEVAHTPGFPAIGYPSSGFIYRLNQGNFP